MKLCEIADNTASVYAYIITSHELKENSILYLKNMLVVREKDGIFLKTTVTDMEYEEPDFMDNEFKFAKLCDINVNFFLP